MVAMVLGVGLALGIGMTLLAVNQASIQMFTGDYQASGIDVYVATRGGKLITFLPGDSPGTIKHAREKLAQIRALPGVSAAIGTLQWPLERERSVLRERDAPAELVSAVGVDGDPTTVTGAVLLREGRWLRRTDEIVMGQRLSFEKGLRVGSRIRLSGRDFTIVGIGRMRGVGFSADSLAYVDLRALQQRADVGDIVNTILVDTSDSAATTRRILDIEGLDAIGQPELIRQAITANESAIALRWILVALILAIAGLFVANMLAGTVAARRQEFGTLRAIGVPTRVILAVVVGEALTVCALAGLVGMAFSLGLGALLNRTLAATYGIESLYVADASLFVTVIGLALGLGTLASLAPAREATRVDPIEVLREA